MRRNTKRRFYDDESCRCRGRLSHTAGKTIFRSGSSVAYPIVRLGLELSNH